jgi:hypothetical protein
VKGRQEFCFEALQPPVQQLGDHRLSSFRRWSIRCLSSLVRLISIYYGANALD